METTDKMMDREKLLDYSCTEYVSKLQYIVYTVDDLQKGVYAGCDWNTGGERHPKAQMLAERYIQAKNKDVVYTCSDMAAAFKYGARELSAIIERDAAKQKLAMKIKREDLGKAMKLICAGQQMMDLAKNFHQEAEELLSKQGEYRTTIKNNFGKLANIFKQTNSLVSKTFQTFTDEEVIDWGEDGEKLEIAVREIFEIK